MIRVDIPVFPRRAVAHAIGVTPKSLGHWLDRNTKIYRPIGETPGGKFEFSPFDLGLLTVVKAAADLGLPISEGLKALPPVLRPVWQKTLWRRNATPNQEYEYRHVKHLTECQYFLSLLTGMSVRFAKDGDKWRLVPEDETPSAFIHVDLASTVSGPFEKLGL